MCAQLACVSVQSCANLLSDCSMVRSDIFIVCYTVPFD